MTISSADRKSQLYIGSGTTGPFAFPFKVFAASEVKVTTSVIATGVETVLSAGEYTVNLNADQDGNPGGSITLATALPTTKNLIITSAVPLTQPVNINNQDGFFAEVVEDALDRSVIQVQQMQTELDRAFKVPLTSGYTDPNEFITDLLNTDAAAQTARVGAEAAETAAVAAQTAAESARDGALTAETNAEGYAATAVGVATRMFTSYSAAVAAGLSNDDLFRVQIGQRIFVYKFVTPGNYGVLQSVIPLNYPEATFASASSSGTSVSGVSIPAGALIDVSGVDALYSYNQIRNRAVDGNPSLNLLGVQDASKQPLRSYISDADPNDTGVYDFNVDNELVVSHLPATGTDTYTVAFPDIYVPPGRWTFAFDAKGIGQSYQFRASADGGATYTPTQTATTTFQTFAITFDNTTEQADTFQFFREVAGTTSLSAIAYKNFRIVPGTSATYTEPANRHGWHKRPWSLEDRSLVPSNEPRGSIAVVASNSSGMLLTSAGHGFSNNDTVLLSGGTYALAGVVHYVRDATADTFKVSLSLGGAALPYNAASVPTTASFGPIVDNLHFQLPLAETKQLNEYTVSFAIKPADNAYANAFSLTSPSTAADKFGMLLVPSTDALSLSSGFISFDHLGSTDDTVQLLGVAIPKEKFSILTVVAPADAGVNSDPARVYINGILLREVEEQIRVKTSSRDADGASLRFNFGKAHRFVEDEPVKLQKDPGAVFPVGVDDATTYYVRPPSSNFQETLLLSTTAGGTPIAFTNPGSGNIFVNSQPRPVGTAPISLNCLSLFGFKTIEPSTFNLKGGFANFVLYDKALTESEVQKLITVQKQRVAAHYEPMPALGSVLLTEGDSITFGVGVENPTQTFRYRLFYGLDFDPKTVSPAAFGKSDNDTLMTTSDNSGNLRFTAVGHGFPQGVSVVVTASTFPDNITAATTYYVNVINDDNIQLTTDETMLNTVQAGAELGADVHVLLADSIGNVREAMTVNLPAHGYDQTGVSFTTTNTLPSGLVSNSVYFAQKQDDNNFFISQKGFVSNSFPLILGQADYGAIGDVTIRQDLSTLDNAATKLNEKTFAVSGATIADTISRKGELLEMIGRVVADGSRPIVTYMAGVNDMIVGGSPNEFGVPTAPLTEAEQTAIINSLKDYWTEIRNAGAKLIVGTITAVNFDPTQTSEPNGPFIYATDTVRNSFNAKIRAASSYYDALADFASYDLLNIWQTSNPVIAPNSYFSDSVHISLRGHLLMSNILSPLVDRFRL